MASFTYEGNTYFYANGRWLDHNSRQLSEELVEKLNEACSFREIKEQEIVQKKRQEAKRIQRIHAGRWGYSGSRVYNNSGHINASTTNYKNSMSHYREAADRIYEDAKLTSEQKRALEVLESGENVFLSGAAGTGKTYVLNEYIRRTRRKNVIVCAPTGIAAINVGGSTLHRVFGIPIRPLKPGEFNTKPSDALMKADIIIIDEISMCRFDVFEYVVNTIQKAEKFCRDNAQVYGKNSEKEAMEKWRKQLIVVGDFFQLPPVILSKDREVLELYWGMDKVKEGFSFQTDIWEKLNFKNIVLKEVVRQKGANEFVDNLNLIREGNVSGIYWFNEKVQKTPIQSGIYLCSTNKKADIINRKKAEEISGKVHKYTAEIIGQVQESDKMTLDELEFKIGMQVMTLVNNHDAGYKNGSIGTIVSFADDYVRVRLNTGEYVDVRVYDWEICGYEVQNDKLVKVVLGNYKQIPLKIAYAITIHKSQGQTYANANISPDCFAAGQLYVALSRVQNIEGISLECDIKNTALITSQTVKEFYSNIDNVLFVAD